MTNYRMITIIVNFPKLRKTLINDEDKIHIIEELLSKR